MIKCSKTLLLFLCVVLFSTHATGQPVSHQRPVSGQVGMYSYRTDTLTGMTTRDGDGNITKKIDIERNAVGRIIRKIHHHPDGRIKLTYAYEFDRDGHLAKKIKQAPDGTPLVTHNYTYDEQNRPVGQTDLDSDGNVKKRHVYAFNEFGERIRKTTYGADGHLKKTKLYIFGDHNRRIRDYSLSADGGITGSTRYIYNEAGKMERIEYFNEKDEMRSYSVITTDADGLRVKNERFNPDNTLKSSIQYQYD
jgi:hypothetical protein